MRRNAIAAVLALVASGVVGGVTAGSAQATSVSTKTLLGQLNVTAEHTTGYDRAKFTLWIDADHDGCNTRYEVLIAEARTKPHVGATCTLSGGKWFSPYDGVTTTNPSAFDIDHLVPLAEAWQSGAWRWDADTRKRYANDLGYSADLIAVSAHSNRSKGDQEPQNWLPPRTSYDCTYTAYWVAVKWRWQLNINAAEKTFLTTELTSCGWPTVTKPTRQAIGSGSSGSGGASASGAAITAIYFDSPGSDRGGTTSLNAEWVQIKNTTSSSKTLTGWTLRDAASHVYAFGTFHLAAGASVKVHTGSGSNTGANLYWRSTWYIWNNSGDTATLRNAAGATVDHCAYGSAADPEAIC